MIKYWGSLPKLGVLHIHFDFCCHKQETSLLTTSKWYWHHYTRLTELHQNLKTIMTVKQSWRFRFTSVHSDRSTKQQKITSNAYMRDFTSPYIKFTLARSRRRSFVCRASSDAPDWSQDVMVDTKAGDVPWMLAADWIIGNLADDAGSAELRLPQLHVIVSAENWLPTMW